MSSSQIDRVVALTGATGGIGTITAHTLLRQGYRVVLGDLDGDGAQALAAGLGQRAIGMELDVTDRASFEAFLDAAIDAFGRLDVLVNNAAIMPLGPLTDEPDELTSKVLAVNVEAVLLGSKLAIPRLAPGGQIINMASAVGRMAMPHAVTYSASKHAVIGATEALRSELAPLGLSASVVVPMVVNTPMSQGLAPAKGQEIVEPDEVAHAIVSAITSGKFETWVPKVGSPFYRVVGLLPHKLRAAVIKSSGGEDLLRDADPAARTEYEARIRG